MSQANERFSEEEFLLAVLWAVCHGTAPMYEPYITDSKARAKQFLKGVKEWRY